MIACDMKNIKRACLEIAYDNGMINRYTPEAEALAEMIERVRSVYGWSSISRVEEELASLNQEQFIAACEGFGVSRITNDLLNVAFEGNAGDYENNWSDGEVC